MALNSSWPLYKQKLFNPLTPHHDFSDLDNENKGNDHKTKKLWLLKKLSLPAPKEMYREQYEEYV